VLAAPFDLTTYLQRIGFTGVPRADVGTLRAMVLLHAQAIAFENLDAFTGRAVSLDPAAVADKLLRRGRGGWCFEQNLLLGEALRALGFPVVDLAARVVWNRPAEALTARTHRLLQVTADGRDWLADAGFGGQTLTGLLDLRSTEPQATPHEPFRLRRLGDELVLESQIRGEWLPLCRFDLQPQLPVDFEAPNYQLAHDPASHFTQGLTVSRVTTEGRHVLRGHPLQGVELAFHASGGESRRIELRSAAEIMQALRAVFRLPVEQLPDLNERVEKLLAATLQTSTGSPVISPDGA
jgi:N-hydroxyarylamine O-acetyltransferase